MQETQVFTALLPQLGLAGIFLGMLVILWRYYEKQLDEHKKSIADKDAKLESLNDKVLTAFTENIKVSTELRHSTEANTKAIESLTSSVYDVIRRK